MDADHQVSTNICRMNYKVGGYEVFPSSRQEILQVGAKTLRPEALTDR